MVGEPGEVFRRNLGGLVGGKRGEEADREGGGGWEAGGGREGGGGGAPALPSYYEKFGGFVISAAINKYVYITVNRTFRPGYLLKYSKLEHAQTVDEIKHDILRETLRLMDVEPAVEIVSIADVPAGTGLGSSGSFTVGLVQALYAHQRRKISTAKLPPPPHPSQNHKT